MIRGSIDFFDHNQIRGWVQREGQPELAISIVISDGSTTLGTAVADKFRPDLKEAGIGEGYHAYEFTFPARLATSEQHSITLRTDDGLEVPGSPIILEALHPTTLAIGHIDRADRRGIEGWTQNDDRSREPAHLFVTDNGELICRILANRYRADLQAAGLGDGRHGFAFDFEQPLSSFKRHFIRVRRDPDGLDVPGSPIIFEPPERFDAAGEAEIRSNLNRYDSEEDIERKIRFLAMELDRLVQQHADKESQKFERQRNRDLARRWGASHAKVAPRNRTTHLRALVIDDRVPALNRDAGSNAIVSHMRSLKRLGYEVSLIPASQFYPDPRSTEHLQSEGVKFFSLPFYGSAEEVLWRQAGEFDLVYLHRITNASKYGELVRQHFPKARRIFSVADLHHLRVSRQAAAENRPELQPLAQRLKFLELLAAASAGAVITHSEFEAEILRSNLPKANIHRIMWDVEPRPTRVPFEKRSGIAFIGGYDHAPNLDAAKWLMSELVPQIQRINSNIECYLVGGGFPEELRKLQIRGVTILGHLANLSDIFDRVRLTVAPLAYGAGVKGKIIESLAAGIPCVHTTLAAEGMELPKELARCCADDPQSIASTICDLHDQSQHYEECARAGIAYVQEELTIDKLDQRMAQAIRTARV